MVLNVFRVAGAPTLNVPRPFLAVMLMENNSGFLASGEYPDPSSQDGAITSENINK
jgi:hypothetical protein